MKAEHVLLLMPCSVVKRPFADQPWCLYQGSIWKTLRAHRGDLPWANVLVLSARYGIITAETSIQSYEEKLTSKKADHIINGTLPDYFKHRKQPFEFVVCAARGHYKRVFDAIVPRLLDTGCIRRTAPLFQVAGGNGIGEQRHQLGTWLKQINMGELK